MDLKEEKILIEKARKNPEVFGFLYDYYYPKIFSYVLKRTANFAVAQDITSDIFFEPLSPIRR